MKTKRLVMPVIITCFVALNFLSCAAYFVYIFVYSLFFSSMAGAGKVISSFLASVGIAVFIALFFLAIKAFKERYNEIRSDEEDDLSKY